MYAVNLDGDIFLFFLCAAMKDVAPSLMEKGDYQYYVYGACDTQPLPAVDLEELIKNSSSVPADIDYKGSIHGRLQAACIHRLWFGSVCWDGLVSIVFPTIIL